MVSSGPEWIIWAQQFQVEQVKTADFIKTLKSTITKAAQPVQVEGLQSNQLALQGDMDSLHQMLAVVKQRREQHSSITAKRLATLEQRVRVEAQKQIRRLEEDLNAPKR